MLTLSVYIETDRLLIREFELADSKAVFEFGSNPTVQKYTGDKILTSMQQATDIILNVNQKDYKAYGYGRWAVIHKADNKLIGFAGLKYLPEFDLTDIGFRFLPEYWGKGLATEASKVILEYGFQHLQLESIFGIAMPENVASCRVLEKLGFKMFKIDDYDGDGGSYKWYKLEASMHD